MDISPASLVFIVKENKAKEQKEEKRFVHTAMHTHTMYSGNNIVICLCQKF